MKKTNKSHIDLITNEEDELFIFYKNRLKKNMDRFNVPLEKRITLDQLFDLKLSASAHLDSKSFADILVAQVKFKSFFQDRYLSDISFQEWMECAKTLQNSEVYRGARTQKGKRQMSVSTLRRNFAIASSCFSFARSQGIPIENEALKVLQTYINPMIKKSKHVDKKE